MREIILIHIAKLMKEDNLSLGKACTMAGTAFILLTITDIRFIQERL